MVFLSALMPCLIVLSYAVAADRRDRFRKERWSWRNDAIERLMKNNWEYYRRRRTDPVTTTPHGRYWWTTTAIQTLEPTTTIRKLKPTRIRITTETSTTTLPTPAVTSRPTVPTDDEKDELDDDHQEEEPFPSTFHLIVIAAVVGIIIFFCIVTCCCCKGDPDAPRTVRSGFGKKRKHKKKAKFAHSSSSSSAPASASASAPVKAEKMKAEKINMMEFADRGALVMQDVKGEVKHALDDVKSGEIVRVQYDTGQNEIVTIGSDVEIIKSSKSNVASGLKSKSGDVKTKTKSIEGPPPSQRKKARRNKTKSLRQKSMRH
ncbi:hypothetical protein GCK32_013572 [Trichostrongylus colubriformis]|uniref:Uncharacterized protein n=1 Tax=Trichostrongylus colubriformis TaxID=6319 RepID=A0AAN8F1Z6_TRICO